MEVMLTVAEGDRTGGYFPKVQNYSYVIHTGSRCSGLVSKKKYKDSSKAYDAGLRMINKVGWKLK